jgi:hypothetical protein
MVRRLLAFYSAVLNEAYQRQPGSSHFPQLRGSALSFEGLLDSSLKFGKELA